MEKKRNTEPTTLEIGETKAFELNEGNEFETTDVITEEGAKYMLVDKSNNGAKVTYKFYDQSGKGFKDVFNKIIANDGNPRLYFASDEQTVIKVKRIA